LGQQRYSKLATRCLWCCGRGRPR